MPKASTQIRQTGMSSQSRALRTSSVARAAHPVAPAMTTAVTRTTTSGIRTPIAATTRTARPTIAAVAATQPGENHGSPPPGQGAAALRAVSAARVVTSKLTRSKSAGARARPVTSPDAVSSEAPAGWWARA